MERINKDKNPIFYKNAAEMDNPLCELMEELRLDITKVRGKLMDIRRSFGWDEQIIPLEGGLTCMLVSMYYLMEEWKRFEEKEIIRNHKRHTNDGTV